MINGDIPQVGLILPKEKNQENYLIGIRSMIVFGVLTMMIVISYFRTMLEDAGTIPDDLEWDIETEYE
jgi:hypothetical protein